MAFTHFSWDNAQLFCGQVVKVKNEPPVEITITIQGSVMDVRLLFLLLHSWHPSEKHKIIEFTFSSPVKQCSGPETGRAHQTSTLLRRYRSCFLRWCLFHPEWHPLCSRWWLSRYICLDKVLQHFYSNIHNNKIHISFLRHVLLLGFAWVNNTWRTWQTEVFGENVNPHLDLSLYYVKKKSWYVVNDAIHTEMVKWCSVVTTWDKFGWWELYRVLVSTCSGTKPWSLRTCRASLSLVGPKCGWVSVLVSAMNTQQLKHDELNKKD